MYYRVRSISPFSVGKPERNYIPFLMKQNVEKSVLGEIAMAIA